MAEQFDDMELTEEEQKMINEGEEQATPAPEEPQQQAQPESAPPTPPQQPEQKMVPLAALQQARHENKAIMQNMESLKQEFLAFRAQQNQPKPPDFEQDPFGNMNHRIEQANQTNQQMAQYIATMQQQQDQQRQIHEVVNFVTQQEAQYRQMVPDYDQAIAYLQDIRVKELQSIGITDPAMITQEIGRLAWQASMAAIQAGQNPVEAMYNIAKHYGYKTPQAQPQQPQNPAQAQSPQELNQRFAAIAKGQAATRTLQRGEGVQQSTVESLLNVDDDDFDKMWAQLAKEGKLG